MLKRKIAEIITQEGGWISLEKYMELSLYDPEHGYYASQIASVGRKGDFSTSATLSPSLGKALAAEYKKCTKQHGTLPIIEVGAGTGELSLSFRKELSFWTRWKADHLIVDTSPILRLLQTKTLGSSITHFPTLGEALAACGGNAFIFSNELVDAFPARVFQKSASNQWEEVGLSIYAKTFVEKHRSAEKLPPSTLFAEYDTPGQRIEIHDSYRKWCMKWKEHWKKGMMITIDYGDLVEGIYYRRSWGTFRGYHTHRLISGIDLYRAPGKIDMTNDVNFSDLIKWGEHNHWKTREIMYQKDFIRPFISPNNEADQFLSNPHGAGTAFRVLIQEPNC